MDYAIAIFGVSALHVLTGVIYGTDFTVTSFLWTVFIEVFLQAQGPTQLIALPTMLQRPCLCSGCVVCDGQSDTPTLNIVI